MNLNVKPIRCGHTAAILLGIAVTISAISSTIAADDVSVSSDTATGTVPGEKPIRTAGVHDTLALAAVSPAPRIKTTEQFIGKTINTAINAILDSLSDKGIDTLYLKAEAPHTAGYLVEDALFKGLKGEVPVIRTADGLAAVRPAAVSAEPPVAKVADSTGAVADDSSEAAIPVTESKHDAGASGYVLGYRVITAAAGLGVPFRKGLFGRKRVVRTGTFECRLRLMTLPGHTIVWTGTAGYELAETIDAADVAVTEHKKFTYSTAPVKRPLWKTAAEVVLAGGTVGALMFLFFTQSFN